MAVSGKSQGDDFFVSPSRPDQNAWIAREESRRWSVPTSVDSLGAHAKYTLGTLTLRPCHVDADTIVTAASQGESMGDD